jgi:hypothetical protein
MEKVELIPPEGEREWVLDSLRGLVEACGHQHVVSTPVVLPSPRCFPDSWSPDAGGVRRLALRIMRYAALDELDVVIQMFEGEEPQGEVLLGAGARGSSQAHEGAAAWFAGIVEDTCLFGANVSLLDDPGGVTAALAHETAHAFREVHGLAVDDRDLEECLTDLTTVYLGTGVLTANASLRHRSYAIPSDGTSLGGHGWSRSQLGYLSPQAMCFALAVFERVRERSAGERKAIVDALGTNQAGFFKAARRWLEREFPDSSALRERLGLPDPSAWPEPTRLEELLARPLEEREDGEDEEDDDRVDTDPSGPVASLERGWNLDGEVWRVPYSPAFGGLLLLATVAAAGLLFATAHPWLAVLAIIAGTATMRRISRRLVRYECSTCGGIVRLEHERCALCGGKVVGTLAKAEDRLELPNP